MNYPDMSADILEIFASAADRSERHDGLTITGRLAPSDYDLGQAWLDADEEGRKAIVAKATPVRLPTRAVTPKARPGRRKDDLTILDAQRIRTLAKGKPGREIARMYDVPAITIQRILNNVTFRADRTRLSPCERRLRSARALSDLRE